jgi:hypothetical protein
MRYGIDLRSSRFLVSEESQSNLSCSSKTHIRTKVHPSNFPQVVLMDEPQVPQLERVAACQPGPIPVERPQMRVVDCMSRERERERD